MEAIFTTVTCSCSTIIKVMGKGQLIVRAMSAIILL